ncbi:MAG TPA: multicopper oxidase domain-containing protein [Actinomycetes bacterium]|nr:multicopper oxidase domain-containing protein [Actinomycetes bacterium]
MPTAPVGLTLDRTGSAGAGGGGLDRAGRAHWHARANAVVLGYLALAGLALVLHAQLPMPRWLAVHLLLLGAVTNAIVTWSEHFAVALLRAPAPSRRRSAARLAVLNLAVVGVLAGVSLEHAGLVAAASVLLGLVVAEHTGTLLVRAHRSLPGRFGRTVRFYVAAGVALLVGATLGALVATGALGHETHEALHAAHVHANLLGWVGLTVLGTLFTLWPTVLHTRMVDGVMRAAMWCLALTTAGLAVAVVGFVLDQRPVAIVGLAGYAAGLAMALRPFVATWRRKRPYDLASWSLAAATGWLLAIVLADLVLLARSADLATYLERLDELVPPMLVGFVGQVLLGALSYLLPVVLGRGPVGARAAARALARAWPARVGALNLGVVLIALPLPDPFPRLGWALVLAALTGFVALAVPVLLAGRKPAPTPTSTAESVTVTHSPTTDSHPPVATPPPAAAASRRRNPALIGLVIGAVMTLIPVGIALSGDAGSGGPATVVASEATQEVPVTLVNMDIRPGVIEVAAGTRLRLVVTNQDAMRHDVAFPDGPKTRLLAKGQSQTLDLGVVTADLSGWCTVPGHKAAGMTLDIKVTGGSAPAANGSAGTSGSMPGMNHGAHGNGSASASEPSVTTVDVHGKPGPGWTPYDATLAPAPGGTVHKITVRASEKDMEVAPGVRQRMWTFNGTVPAPTLRGQVGDVFEVTLVNDASMGHGIDFHAGSLAPDVPMRTIDPGESLVYRFRADFAGAWLYHCSTMPMLAHIGNGMYGAIIIDPPGLPKVDREYVLVSAEQYLGPQGGIADMAKLRANAWDTAVFNGYPDQYVHAPLTARVGERVRFWVVAAGPIEGTALHIVGAQFDTVYKEGAYLLRAGNADRGAAQVLDLAPAQGGFVETVFPEAGHYPLMDHDMRRGENGAHGVVEVTP